MGSEIPEWAMEAAMEALKSARPAYDTQDQYDKHWESVARALVAAERRGIERAATLLSQKATEIGFSTPTTGMMARIFEDEAAAIRQLGDTP